MQIMTVSKQKRIQTLRIMTCADRKSQGPAHISLKVLQSNTAEEFSPDPENTFRIITDDYHISRNMVVKFLDDSIDQSVDLCQVWKLWIMCIILDRCVVVD